MKELQRELEDSHAAQREVLSSARESDRRSKAMEADVIQLQEVCVCKGFRLVTVISACGELSATSMCQRDFRPTYLHASLH